MKKYLVMLLMCAAYCSTFAQTQITVDGINYELNNGEAKVVKGSTISDGASVYIPSSVSYNGVSYPVTAIGAYALGYYPVNNYIFIDLPNTLRTIEAYAFNESKISYIYIPEGVTSIGVGAFSRCFNLSSIHLPSTLETIGSGAFVSCQSLKYVFIPQNVSEIGYAAFEACKALSEFGIDSSNNCYSVEDGVLFNKDKSTLIKYPCGKAGVEYNVPESVTNIERAAFRYNSDLATVNIPNGVASIGTDSFYDCASMTAINVAPDNSQYMSDGGIVFSCDKSILHYYPTGISSTKYNVPDGVLAIGDFAFNGNKNLVSASLPDGVTSIGYCAFAGCTSLVSLDVSKTVNYIGGSAFQQCTSLKNINIPQGVVSIEDGTFSGCEALKTIKLPSSIKSIGNNAFPDIEELVSLATTPPIPSDNAFSGLNYETVTVYVPNEAISAYKLTYLWCNFWKIKDIADYSDDVPGDISQFKTYIDNEDNIVVNGYEGNDEDIVIPAYAYVDGMKRKVVKIGNRAFRNRSNIKSCVIPSTVKEIGSSAFEDCTSLKSVNIGDNEEQVSAAKQSGSGLVIGIDAFSNTGLEEVFIPSTVTIIGSGAFNCKNLREINVSENNSSYSSIDGVLYNKDRTILILCPIATALTELTVPNSVNVIRNGAFYRCNSLISVNLPASVTKIDSYSGIFYYCSNLQSINVDEGNANYSSINGVLYNGDKTELLECPMGYPYENLIIPEGVTKLNNSACQVCKGLRSVSLPSSITEISDDVFLNCFNIETITSLQPDPNKITMSSNAFSYSFSLGKATLYVPEGSVEVYKNAEVWKKFGTIEPIKSDPTSINSIVDAAAEGKCYNLNGQRVDAPTKSGLYIINGKKVVVK